jgi:serine protease inhibitor
MQPHPPDPAAIADDQFGTGLYGLLAGQAQDLVFSPASVAAALQLALCGAAGETAAELAAALHLAAGPQAAQDAAAAGLRSLSALQQEVTKAGDLTFRVANTAWVQSGFPLQPAFTERLGGTALATFAGADFAGAPEGARDLINQAIEEQTAGKITGLLPAGSVSTLTRLVLANAVYLKAPWLRPFKPDATRDEPFYPAEGSELAVPMMHGAATRDYLRGDGYQAVVLRYAGGRLAMAVILPDGPLTGLRPKIAAAGLRGLLAGTSRHQVTLSLPRFRVESSLGLVPVLQSLGIAQAFAGTADFSGITAAEPLRIGAVAHKAYVDVDEQGTEAAAATGIMFVAAGLLRPPPAVTVVVDRPFVFAIIDTATTTPLFLGQVTNPHR